jgi:DNA replication protein DnaC
MINDETRRKLRELNLSETIDVIDDMERDVSYISLSFDERIQRLVDYLYQEKFNGKVQRLIRLSKFRIARADIHDFLYLDRGIDRQVIQELATCQFLENYSNIVCQGFTGSGKTFLACAIGRQACRRGVRTRYVRIPDLLVERDEASIMPKGLTKLLRKYAKYELLILDEWLLDPMAEDEQHFLFELMERRYDKASTIFCTQYRKTDWHSRLGGGVHADAIMDRIVHNAVWIDSGTKNMRELESKKRLT